MESKLLKKYWRIMDVNFNRAREGLRVIEDTARFIGNDEVPVRRVRKLRQKLGELNRQKYFQLLRFRNVESDCGREFKENGGYKNIAEIVQANFRRTEEALRVLEEYSRFVSRTKRQRFKQLRFALYQLEKDFHQIV